MSGRALGEGLDDLTATNLCPFAPIDTCAAGDGWANSDTGARFAVATASRCESPMETKKSKIEYTKRGVQKKRVPTNSSKCVESNKSTGNAYLEAGQTAEPAASERRSKLGRQESRTGGPETCRTGPLSPHWQLFQTKTDVRNNRSLLRPPVSSLLGSWAASSRKASRMAVRVAPCTTHAAGSGRERDSVYLGGGTAYPCARCHVSACATNPTDHHPDE